MKHNATKWRGAGRDWCVCEIQRNFCNDLRKAKVRPSQQTTVEGHYTFGSDLVLLYLVLIFPENTEV